MGAYSFQSTATGKDAQEAFSGAVSQAQWEHGHGGYSGTIAEKHSFRTFTLPTLPEDMSVNTLIGLILGYFPDDDEPLVYGGKRGPYEKDPETLTWGAKWIEPPKPVPADLVPFIQRVAAAVDDKWGDAGCFEITGPDEKGERTFVFFGYASS